MGTREKLAVSTAFTGDDVCLFYFSLVNLFSKVMRDGAHSPRIRLASLFFFTECKPPIPQTVHSKPRHMQVTFRGNSRGVNGMKDRSSLWDVTVKVRGKKARRLYLPSLLILSVFWTEEGSGCVCILVVVVEWPLGGKKGTWLT